MFMIVKMLENFTDVTSKLISLPEKEKKLS